ncbi:hypothetical protein KI440_01380 [Candidatus Saccharibacteria bacterium TM7i]|nr:hypothetical protein KI440_01380 [Candidatus Saccharibacteria bacterium TM7i]
MPFESGAPLETQTAPSDEIIPQAEALVYADKKIRRRRRRILGAEALLLATTTALGSYALDVNINMERQASAEASVSVYDKPLDSNNDSSAVVFFNGFGTYDADPIAKVFGPGIKQNLDGESWSVSYGNAPLNPKKLAEKIISLAEERDITTLDFVGYSAGGAISTETATEIADNPDITIRSLTPISTPDGIDGLRPLRQKEVEFAYTLSSIPGAKYSTLVRLIGEIYFMRDRFDEGPFTTRIADFGKTALQAAGHIQQPKLPGTWLLVDQTLAVADADIQSNLKEIAEKYKGKKPLPTILYVGTEEPGYDYMVNNELSSYKICGYAYENNMQCSIYNVPGAVHTMPEKTTDAYTETFADAKQELDEGIGIAQLNFAAQLREALVKKMPNVEPADASETDN